MKMFYVGANVVEQAYAVIEFSGDERDVKQAKLIRKGLEDKGYSGITREIDHGYKRMLFKMENRAAYDKLLTVYKPLKREIVAAVRGEIADKAKPKAPKAPKLTEKAAAIRKAAKEQAKAAPTKAEAPAKVEKTSVKVEKTPAKKPAAKNGKKVTKGKAA